eukprot:gene2963-4973_t
MIEYKAHKSLGSKCPWILEIVSNEPRLSIETLKQNEETAIAFVQYNIISQWISEVSSNLYQSNSSKMACGEHKTAQELRVFRRLAVKIFSAGVIDPMTTITGIFLFQKVLNSQNNFSFDEFRLTFLNCIMLSQKMYEDHVVTSGDFYDKLNLGELNIDFDDFIETEKTVLQALDYNLFIMS